MAEFTPDAIAAESAGELSPEEAFLQGIIDWVQALPLDWALPLTVLLLLALLGVCWSLPRHQVLADAPAQRWRDLRIWASVLILLQIGLYGLLA